MGIPMPGMNQPKTRRTSMGARPDVVHAVHVRGDRSPRLRSSMEKVEEESIVTSTEEDNFTSGGSHQNGRVKDTVGKEPLIIGREPNGSAQTGTLAETERRESNVSTSSAKQVTFDVTLNDSKGGAMDKNVANGPVPLVAPPAVAANNGHDTVTIVQETETNNGLTKPTLKKQKVHSMITTP